MLVFAVLFLLYQSAEGVGARLLHSFPVQAVLMSLVLPVAAGLGWIIFRAPLGCYQLDWGRGRMRILGCGLAAAVLAKAIALVAGAWLGIYAIEWKPISPGQVPAVLLGALGLTFIPSIAEDLLTRGLWYRRVAVGLPFILLTATVYLLNHIFRLALGPIEWFRLFTFGLAYAAGVERTRTLWGAVGLHWGWNAANEISELVLVVDVGSPPAAVAVSSFAHLALCAVVVFWWRPLDSSRGAATPRKLGHDAC